MAKPAQTRRLFSDASWALAGQVLSAMALLIGTRLLTELINPEVYGQVALLNGYVALGVAVFAYPFICAGMRLWPECRSAAEQKGLYAAVIELTLPACGLALGGLLVGSLGYTYVLNLEMAPFLVTGLLLAVTVQRELGVQLAIGQRQQRRAALWQTSDSLLRPVLAIALVVALGGKAEMVLLGYALASLLSNLFWQWLQRDRRRGAECERDFGREVWVYALPLIPMELIFWINGLGDRYVIGYMLTAADVGLYAATYTLVNEAFNRSAMVLLRTFQPAYFQAYAEQSRRSFQILWLWIASVAGMGTLGLLVLVLAKEFLAGLVLAKSYHAATNLMPAMALGCCLHALGTAMAQPLLARKQTKRLFKGRLCGALAAAIAIPSLVSQFGLIGAAWANPVYFGVEALILALLAKPWRDRQPSLSTLLAAEA